MILTWNNQPGNTTTNQVSIAAPASGTANFSVDVTQLVLDTFSGVNYGLVWLLQNESAYRSVNLATSDHASEPARRPKLSITYTVPSITTYYIRDAAGNVIATYQK